MVATVLFLSANPSDTSHLGLDDEHAAIADELERAKLRDDFRLEAVPAARVEAFRRSFEKHRPAIVHFGGHGARAAGAWAKPGDGSARGVEPEQVEAGGASKGAGRGEILVKGEDGRAAAIPIEALAEQFRIDCARARDPLPVRCVVLNACHTLAQAEAIAKHVDCAIGTTNVIADEAAIAFARGFYFKLFSGSSVQEAFDQGQNEIRSKRLGDPGVLVLRCRDGVKAEEVRLAEGGGAKAPLPEQVAIGRLPVPGKYLFGREEELARLDACWSDAGTRVVSIVALGGAGKSALVDAWLRRMQKDGWRGAERVFGWSFWSQGSSNTAAGDTFIAEALRWFGNTDAVPVSAWDRGALLARLVKQRRTLLVLDGLEPLQAPPGPDAGKIRDHGVAALVRELAADGRGLCVVSSRIAVADLASREDGPAPKIDLDQLSPEDGAELLEVLGARGPKAELEQTVREMKGHALALTLLARYLADACDGDIRKRKEIGPLEDDVSGGEHARRVMAAYALWVGEGPALQVLRLLGLFDRPADEGCLRALRVAPVIPKLTEGLVGISDRRWNQTVAMLRRAQLVTQASEGEPGAIDAHPLVREHFGARLREEAPEAWREGHGRLFEHLQKVAPELPEDTVAMTPLYAAVVHGCHAGRRQEALEEVLWTRVHRGQAWFNVNKLGAFGAEVGMLAAFFDPPWTCMAPGLTEAAEGFVLNTAGFVLRALGRLDEAVEPMRRGFEQAIAREAWENAAIAAGNLSQLHLARGAVRDAVASARQSVELADRSGEGFQRSARRTSLANALHQAGRLDDARALFEEAEALQAEQQPTYPLLYAFRGFQYCDLLLDQRHPEIVLDRARRMFDWRVRSDSLLTRALDHLSLGRAHLLLALRDRTGDLTPARAEIDQAVTGLRQAGTQHELPRGLLARAELHLAAGDLPAAEQDLDEALSIATRGGMRLHETDAQLDFARLHLARGDRNAARACFAAAKALVERTGYHRRDQELADIEAALARAATGSSLPRTGG